LTLNISHGTIKKKSGGFLMKKQLAILIAAAMLVCNTLPVYADQDKPTLQFQNLSIGTVYDKVGPDGYHYNCIYSDLFYIEYPGSFVFGQSGDVPIIFYDRNDQVSTSDNEFKTFQDDHLIGSAADVAAYITAGGINSYLQETLTFDISQGYTLVNASDDDYGVLYFLLVDKDNNTTASIIVWTSFGQISIRSEVRTAYTDPLTDHGTIALNPVWDDVDFSSVEALGNYVSSTSIPFNNITTVQTEYHEFLCCETETDQQKMAFYFPVTPEGQQKWILLISVSKDSQMEFNAYAIREDIIKTFHSLK